MKEKQIDAVSAENPEKKKKLFIRLEQFVKNRSFRTLIITSILIAILFMNLVLICIIRMNLSGMKNLGNAYVSNTEINNFNQCLAQTERAMEIYVTYRTFESIDAYYSSRGKLEEMCDRFHKFPSESEVKQKEYVVSQLTKSFIFYSNKAISARRAYSAEEVQVYYKKSVDCYNLLLSELLELNKLQLQKNAINYEKNLNEVKDASTFSFVFFASISSIIILVLYLVITSLTKPLVEISAVAHRVSKRDFDVPLFNNESNNEIGNICQAFDRMIISIREYIDTIWEKARTEAELKEKEMEMQALYTDAQLRALQNQINPHFLFNTLNTGAQLAMMEGADKTCYFIEQVSDFFRYKIQNQGQTASIDDELGLVDNFVYIMKVRFGQRLNFQKNIPEFPLNDQIPIMTLQPLVENCIKHGLKNEQGDVLLNVQVLEKYVEISISDNGEGMSEEIRESVFAAVAEDKTQLTSYDSELEQSLVHEKGTGTGLVNVFVRLKLYFHRDDIFEITSGDNNIGTKFIIRIPHHV